MTIKNNNQEDTYVERDCRPTFGKDQTYHIYRTRKHVREAYNPTRLFQHGFKGLWFIGYEDELAYDSIEASDLEYVGCMTRGDFEKYCDRSDRLQRRV